MVGTPARKIGVSSETNDEGVRPRRKPPGAHGQACEESELSISKLETLRKNRGRQIREVGGATHLHRSENGKKTSQVRGKPDTEAAGRSKFRGGIAKGNGKFVAWIDRAKTGTRHDRKRSAFQKKN